MEYFSNPPKQFRSFPFWAWNDALDKAELRRQVCLMKEAGYGGFFMHSREGLETGYLSEEWDECVRTSVEEADNQGLDAWLYDEDRWPSGFCGGKVQQAVGGLTGLTLEVSGGRTAVDDCLSCYAVKLDGLEILSSRTLPAGSECEEGETLLIARLEESGPSAWFNNNPPPNNLDPGSVQAFIAFTHEHYKAVLGGLSGKVRGIFTDEPSLCDRHAAFNPKRGWIPWIDGYEKYIEEVTGCDILPLIPYIYFNGDKSPKARHDYWRANALRFEACYSVQISRWCKENGIVFTGHFLQEDKLGLCARVNGSIMPHYTHQDMVGVDLLCEQTDEYMTIKQCASVAHQYGISHVLAETYAATGWEFSLEGQKWIGDWLYVLGVNHRCQHAMHYSLKGSRKRDYPPCFSSIQSWWGKSKLVEDYFARLSLALSKGRAVRRIGIVHPISSAWSLLGADPYGNPDRNNDRDIPAIDGYGYEFNAFLKELCSLHLDADLLDETLLERDGSVCGSRLRLKDAEYDLVLVPHLHNIEESTLSLLKQYKAEGGVIAACLPYPYLVSGSPSEEAAMLLSTVPSALSQAELPALAASMHKQEVSVTEDGSECPSVLYQLREDGLDCYLFLVNNDREAGHGITVSLSFSGAVTELKPLTGEEAAFSVDFASDEGMGWSLSLEPCGSRLYLIEKASRPSVRLVPAKQANSAPVVLDGPFNYVLDMPDALTLDRAEWSFSDGIARGSGEVWQAQNQIRDELGMRRIDSEEVVQRYQWIGHGHKNNGTVVRLSFSFVSDITVEGAALAVEQADKFSYELDGTKLEGRINGYYLDRIFQTVPLPVISPGRHVITLVVPYTEESELEAVYLTGNFGVSVDRRLVNLPSVLTYGSWTGQGLLHYPGAVTYKARFNSETGMVKVRLDNLKASVAEVTLNGVTQTVPWKADAVLPAVSGENELSIKLYSSPRNLLGPFHLIKQGPFVNPDCFMPKPENHTNEYKLFDYGLYNITIIMGVKDE